jgi:hypothetical protein
MKKMILLLGFLTTTHVMAIDTARCPADFQLTAKVESVFKSSIYSATPGWNVAQKTLQDILASELVIDQTYALVGEKINACIYKNDETGDLATLTTVTGNDPEEYPENQIKSDMLIINFKIDKSNFMTFVPVEKYDSGSIKSYGSDKGGYSSRIRSKLFYPKSKKFVNFDMGMVSSIVR